MPEVARSWAPIFPVHAYDAEGNMKYYEDGNPMYDAGNGETDGTSKRPTATNQNVIANMKEDIRETVYNNLTSRSYLEISFLKNFKFTVMISRTVARQYSTLRSSVTDSLSVVVVQKEATTLRLPTSTRFWPTAMYLAITTTCRPR